MGLTIQKAIFVKTGTSNDQIGRSFTTQLSPMTMRAVSDKTRGGAMLEPENFSGISGQILRPDMTGCNRALNIPGGWGQERMRFLIKAGYGENEIAGAVSYYYTGYTDYVGVNNNSNNFDPAMRLYFNNAISVSTMMVPTPQGLRPVASVQDISHVLTPSNLGGNLNSQTFNGMTAVDHASTLRPMDLFDNLLNSSASLMNDIPGTMPNQPIINLNAAIISKKSSRTNSLPANYLSHSLKNLAQAKSNADETGDLVDIYSSAAGLAADQTLYMDPLIGTLYDAGFGHEGAVTFGAISQLYPTLNSPAVLKFVEHGKVEQGVVTGFNGDKYSTNRGESEMFVNHVGDVNVTTEALLATTVSQMIPGILLNNYITRCLIRVTNMTMVPGQLHIEVTSPASYVDLPPEYLISRIPMLKDQLAAMVFKDLPIPVGMPFSFMIVSDVFGHSFVNVSINGKPDVPFSIPQYCDAMMSLLVANSTHPLNQISNDIKFISDGAF